MLDILRRCGAFAASLERVPPGLRSLLRAQRAMVVASSFRAEEPALTAWARRSSGPHPLLGFAEPVARMESIVAGVTRGAGGEWALLGRAGAPAVIVALSLGAAADKTVDDLDRAQLAAVELSLRFGLATVLGPHVFEDAPCVAAVAGAVAAARVLGLDGERSAHAIARAIAQPQLAPFRSKSAESTLGAATLDGVIAAELAFEGGALPELIASGPLAFASRAFARLGEVWLTSTIQIAAHDAPAAAQSAVEATNEVLAQARAVRRTKVAVADVRSIEVETTAFGASGALPLGVPKELVSVRHAWDLTSGFLLRVAQSIAARELFGTSSARELATMPLRLLDVGTRLGLTVPSIGQVSIDLTRLFTTRGAFDPRPIALGNRVHLTTRDGQRFSADRSEPVVPGPDRMLAIARARLVEAATPRLGARRAERLAEVVTAPRGAMKLRELVALTVA